MMHSKKPSAFIKEKQKGFTLIELLVIFSVIAILSGIGTIALSTYSQSQQLTQTSNSIKLLVQEAKFNAISNVNSITNEDGSKVSCGARKLNGYLARVNINLNRAQLFMVCENTLPVYVLIREYQLPNPITLASSTTCGDVQFDALTSLASGAPCKVDVKGFGEQKSVQIDSGGNIFVN